MKTLFALVCTVLLVSVLVTGHEFIHGPYCGAPDEDGVTVCWLSDALLDSARIEYCTEESYEAEGVFTDSIEVLLEEGEKPATVSFELQGLEPGTRYCYRVVTTVEGVEQVSPIGSFSTEPAPGTTVRFGVLSDTQLQHEGTNRLELVGDAMGQDGFDYDFILHAGDVVESSSTYYWDHWFAAFDDMLLRAPFIPVLGNHEKNHRFYYEFFTLPPGAGKHDERWWALHYGDVVVVGLDTNVRRADEIQEQQVWAREHLSGPEPHKFVIFHHPVFTSDSEYGTGYFFDKIYHPIFVETQTDIVFNGHSHHYEHIERDGVVYLVVGGGGATPRRTKPDHIQGSDVSVEGRHFYVQVTTSPDGIDVNTVSAARETLPEPIPTPGESLDSFSLEYSGAVAVVDVPATHEDQSEAAQEPLVEEVEAVAETSPETQPVDEAEAPVVSEADELAGADESPEAEGEGFPPWGVALIVIGVGFVAIVGNLIWRGRKR